MGMIKELEEESLALQYFYWPEELAAYQKSRNPGDGYWDDDGPENDIDNAPERELLVMIRDVGRQSSDDSGGVSVGRGEAPKEDITLTLKMLKTRDDLIITCGGIGIDSFDRDHFSAVLRRDSQQKLQELVGFFIQGKVKKHIRISFPCDDTTAREEG